MGGCMWRSDRRCKAHHRQGCKCKNYLKMTHHKQIHTEQAKTWLLETLHQTTQFCIMVNDFGVRCVGRENAKHLKQVLEKHYEIATDWSGTKYIRLTFEWNYATCKYTSLCQAMYRKPSLNLSTQPQKPQHQINSHIPPKYGQKRQLVEPEDTTPHLNKTETKFV